MYLLHLLVVLLCIITRIQSTRDSVTGVIQSVRNVKSAKFNRVKGVIQNFIPGNNKNTGRQKRPKPSYGAPKPTNSAPRPSYGAPKPSNSAPKPSYGAPNAPNSAPKPSYGAPKPSYGPPKANKQKPRYKGKPSYKARKPANKNPSQNLRPPSSPNPQPPSLSQYNPTQTSQSPSSLTDQQMVSLILSMHSMMQQIVANQATQATISTESVDSYGTPQGSPLGSSVSSPPVTTANTNTPTQPLNNYNGPQPSNNNQATSYTQNINDPVIKSTLEQIARTLAEYEPDNQNENISPRRRNENQTSSSVKTEYKPVRFPRNPSFKDILAELERRKGVELDEKETEESLKRKAEIPDLKIDTFF